MLSTISEAEREDLLGLSVMCKCFSSTSLSTSSLPTTQHSPLHPSHSHLCIPLIYTSLSFLPLDPSDFHIIPLTFIFPSLFSAISSRPLSSLSHNPSLLSSTARSHLFCYSSPALFACSQTSAFEMGFSLHSPAPPNNFTPSPRTAKSQIMVGFS